RYLGAAFRPFVPAVRTEGLRLAPGITLERLEDRKKLLAQFDGLSRDLDDRRGNLAAMDSFTTQALEMVTSSKVRDAFDISKAPERDRAKYGDGMFLQARRLVEAGVAMVTLSPLTGWDHHRGLFREHRSRLVAGLDQGVHALVTDLCERGLDKDVTVVIWGEM